MSELFSATLPALFQAVLAMSLTAAAAALAVMLARLVMKALGAPRLIGYLLWALVLFRMVCPVSFTSQWSLLAGLGLDPAAPVQAITESYSGDTLIQWDTPQGHNAYVQGVHGGGQAVNPAPAEGGGSYVVTGADGASPPATVGNRWLPTLSAVWAFGALAFCLWALISYLRLKRRVAAAVLSPDGAWESDRIPGPFVLGLLPAKVYVPAGLSGDARRYVLLHERAHIRRLDHLVKGFSFLALSLHWFNPVLWLAWVLACRDMEAVCDESVLRNSPQDIRKDYSAALLSLASPRPLGAPLAFGENDVKGRVKGILRYKKPIAAVVVGFTILAIALGYALAADPVPLPDKAPGLSVEFASSDVLELTPVLSRWDGGGRGDSRPDLDTQPFATGERTLDLRFTGAAPDEVTVTDYLLGDATQPGHVLTPSPYGGGQGLHYLLELTPHPASAVSGPELHGYVVTARWKSGGDYAACQYGFQLLTPAADGDGLRREPFVTAAGAPIPVRQGDTFPSVEEQTPAEVPYGTMLSVFNPQIEYEAVWATRYLLAEDGSVLSYIGENGSVNGSNQPPAGHASSFGFRIGAEEVGLIGVVLRYEVPEGNDRLWCFTFRGGEPETPYPEWRLSDGDGAPYLRYPGAVDWTPVLPMLPLPAEWETDTHAPAIDGVTGMEGVYGGCFMGFTSPSEGWLVLGGSGAMGTAWNYVYRTRDGGRTWTETGNPNRACRQVLNYAAFATPEIGFLCYRYEWGGAPIYWTQDGGETWALYELPLPAPGDTVYEVNSISFDGPNGSMDLTRHAFNGDGMRVDTGVTFRFSGYGAAWDPVDCLAFEVNVDPYSLHASDLPQGPALSTRDAGYREDQPVRLLAELPGKGISLYALNEYWLGTGGILLVRDRDMGTARWYEQRHSILVESASLYLGDFDGDGEEELAADMCIGHGTGVNDHALSIFALEGRDFGTRAVFDEEVYRPLVLAALADLGAAAYDRFGQWVSYEFDGDAIGMNLAVQNGDGPYAMWNGSLTARVVYDGKGFALEDCAFQRD